MVQRLNAENQTIKISPPQKNHKATVLIVRKRFLTMTQNSKDIIEKTECI